MKNQMYKVGVDSITSDWLTQRADVAQICIGVLHAMQIF